ncbi:hypothetical protein EDB19DRAFT_1753047 [Suillus lakei]|nr:hypothetical protein EDB19DRAFT_1753047 [Suillus lakei]
MSCLIFLAVCALGTGTYAFLIRSVPPSSKAPGAAIRACQRCAPCLSSIQYYLQGTVLLRESLWRRCFPRQNGHRTADSRSSCQSW